MIGHDTTQCSSNNYNNNEIPSCTPTATILVQDSSNNSNNIVQQSQSPQAQQQQQQQQSVKSHINNSSISSSAWDTVPPIMKFDSTTKDWKELSTYDGTLQYQFSTQHMGTCSVGSITNNNDMSTTSLLLSSSSITTTTTKGVPQSQSQSSLIIPSTISTNPIVIPIRSKSFHRDDDNNNNNNTSSSSNTTSITTTTTSLLVVGYHDGSICCWDIMTLPALKHYIHNYNNTNHQQSNHTVVIDTLSPIPPLSIVYTQKNTNNNNNKTNDLVTDKKSQQLQQQRNENTMSSIVQLVQKKDDNSDEQHNYTTFFAINIIGIVYRIQIIPMDEKQTMNNIMVIQGMWDTNRIGPTCCCIRNYWNNDNAGITTTTTTIMMIGYQSGHIECWSIQEQEEEKEQNRVKKQLNVSLDDATDDDSCTFTLQWCCHFTNDLSTPPPSIGAIELLTTPITTITATTTAAAASTTVTTQAIEYLVVTLNNTNGSNNENELRHLVVDTSAMVEVIDISSIANAWIQLPNDNDDDDNNDSENIPVDNNKSNHNTTKHRTSIRSISIDNHIVLPQVGREIRNVYPLNWDHSYIQSRSTNCLCSINSLPSSSSSSLQYQQVNSNVVVVGHADGMITILDMSQPITNSTNMEWGVSSLYNRYCLSYPCIGMGRIDLYETDNDDSTDTTTTYIACCLRGSSTYLIPIESSSVNGQQEGDVTDDDPILALSIPHDMDKDISTRYVQGFTTTNIIVNNKSIPLLIYTWPGGVIDIYSCGLLLSPINPSM